MSTEWVSKVLSLQSCLKEEAITISEREMGAPSSPRVPPSLPGESMQEAAIGNLVGGA